MVEDSNGVEVDHSERGQVRLAVARQLLRARIRSCFLMGCSVQRRSCMSIVCVCVKGMSSLKNLRDHSSPETPTQRCHMCRGWRTCGLPVSSILGVNLLTRRSSEPMPSCIRAIVYSG